MDVKFSKLLRLQYFDVGMGENLSTSLGQKSVSVSEILSERKNARACSDGCNRMEHTSVATNVCNIVNTYACACSKLHLGAGLRAFAIVGGQSKDHIPIECVRAFGEDKRFIGQLGAGLQERQ